MEHLTSTRLENRDWERRALARNRRCPMRLMQRTPRNMGHACPADRPAERKNGGYWTLNSSTQAAMLRVRVKFGCKTSAQPGWPLSTMYAMNAVQEPNAKPVPRALLPGTCLGLASTGCWGENWNLKSPESVGERAAAALSSRLTPLLIPSLPVSRTQHAAAPIAWAPTHAVPVCAGRSTTQVLSK